MNKSISRIIKFVLPNPLFLGLRDVYLSFGKRASRSELDPENLGFNERVLKKMEFDVDKIKQKMSGLNISYFDGSVSWHYHLFAGLSEYYESKNIEVSKILEIGTHNGKFANYLSRLFSNAEIYTIDLSQDDRQFKETYNRHEEEKRGLFLSERKRNIDRNNIKFIEMNSIQIFRYFKEMKFDIVWIDGDHHNPQVTIDIINALNLIGDTGVICVDDVVMDDGYEKTKYVSIESYQTLKSLEINGLINNYFLVKRIRSSNAKCQKYISLSMKIG